jgi:hypothetical protein
MKIDPADQETDTETDGTATATVVDGADETTETGDDGGGAIVDEVEPLTITLPDGSESVSEAILSHRRMLTNPSDHGLVSADDAAAVQETVSELSEAVPDELHEDIEAIESSVADLAAGLDRQERQLRELRETVTSLAEILGASVEFRTFDGNEADDA